MDLLQGTLDLLILQTLRWKPLHGYAITQAIRARSGNLLQVDTGSLYPALHRLEKRGWVEAAWKMSDNNHRTRVYSLSDTGRKQLEAERSRWAQFSSAVAGILSPRRRGGEL